MSEDTFPGEREFPGLAEAAIEILIKNRVYTQGDDRKKEVVGLLRENRF
jgi:hypothetical protein